MRYSWLIALLLLLAGCGAGATDAGQPSAAPAAGSTLVADLAQLDALHVPPGVRPQDFAQLKAALRTALLARGESRSASSAPPGTAGQVTDLDFGTGADVARLRWTYVNQGDYDQNSEVTVADLTPLGINLHETPASPDWLTKGIAADGDQNGEVTIADITPIGKGLHNRVDGYHLQGSPTPAIETSWNDLTDVDFDAGAIDHNTSPFVRFDFLVPSPLNTSYYRVVPYSGTDRGLPSNPVQFTNGVTTVTIDSAGKVGGYTSLALVNGHPAISYYDYDNGDLKYARSTTFDGSGVWTEIVVDTAGDVGTETSLAVISGKPAISYHDNTNDDLKYAYSVTLDGSNPADWISVTIDSPGGVGHSSSLAEINGKPGISYYDFTGSQLKYAFSSMPDGSSGWTTISVDNGSANTGLDTSLAVVGGQPAISYIDQAQDQVKYAYSAMLDGSSGWTSVVVDNSGSKVSKTSLVDNGGHPAMSYIDGFDGILEYAYCSTADGTGTWDATSIDFTSTTDNKPTLALVGGFPTISYLQTGTGLGLAASSDASGITGWTYRTIDGSADVGQWSSLAQVNGKAAVSYFDTTNGDLKYVAVP